MFGYQLYIILIYVGLALLIPAGAIIGQFAPGGPRAITSGAALVALAAFWALAQGMYLDHLVLTQRFTSMVVAVLAGVALTLAAWTLALADTAHARRWGWYVAALFAGFVAFAAIGSFALTPPIQACAYSLSTAPCTTGGVTYYALAVTGSLVGPATMLAYALRHARSGPSGASARQS